MGAAEKNGLYLAILGCKSSLQVVFFPSLQARFNTCTDGRKVGRSLCAAETISDSPISIVGETGKLVSSHLPSFLEQCAAHPFMSIRACICQMALLYSLSFSPVLCAGM